MYHCTIAGPHNHTKFASHRSTFGQNATISRLVSVYPFCYCLPSTCTFELFVCFVIFLCECVSRVCWFFLRLFCYKARIIIMACGLRLFPVVLVIVASAFSRTAAHTYHTGECPSVEPMSGFEMRQVSGKDRCVDATNVGEKQGQKTCTHCVPLSPNHCEG